MMNIQIQNGILSSHQRNDKKAIYRIANFKKSYFEEINGREQFMIKDFTSTIRERFKNLKNHELITIEKEESLLLISSESGYFTINTYQAQSSGFPLTFDKDIMPSFKGQTLDVHFEVNRKDIIGITKNLKSRDILTFQIKNGVFSVIDYKRGKVALKCNFHTIQDLTMTFGSDIRKAFECFSNDSIHIYSQSKQPAWFLEINDEYAFGILLKTQDYEYISTGKDMSIFYGKIVSMAKKMGGIRGGQIQLEGRNAYVTNTKRTSLYKFELDDYIGTGSFYANQAVLKALEIKRGKGKVLMKIIDGIDETTVYVPDLDPFDKDFKKRFKSDYTDQKIVIPCKLFDIFQYILITKLQIKDEKLLVTQIRSDGTVGFKNKLALEKDFDDTVCPDSEEISFFTNDLLVMKSIVKNSVFFGFNGQNPLSVLIPFSGGKLEALIGALEYS